MKKIFASLLFCFAFSYVNAQILKDLYQLEISLNAVNTSKIGGSDGEIDLTITGGVTPYSISWSNGSTNEDISNLTAGAYSVTVTDSLNNIVTGKIRIYDTFIDDRDGQKYKAIEIGDQIWMAENLAYLPSVVGPGTGSYSTPYYYVYGYDGTSVTDAKATTNYKTYGVLHNWPAALQACPAGWHLPIDKEWTMLENYLIANGYNYDGTTTDNKIAKSLTSSTLWASSTNTGAIGNTDYPAYRNLTGFTALPGGCRNFNGKFDGKDSTTHWWSASEGGTTDACYRVLYYFDDYIRNYYGLKYHGFSVRCLRNPCAITLSLSKTDITCHGGSDGSINLSVTGSDKFSVEWSTGDTTLNIQNLKADWYNVTVIDSENCFSTNSIEINEPPSLLINLESTNTCPDDSTAIIISSVTGGTQPYIYSWNNYKTTPNLSNVARGIYILSITDDRDCMAMASDTVKEFPVIQTSQITGHTNVEPAEVYQYSVSQKIGSEFNWIVEGGNIVSGQKTNSINVQWGSPGTGKISVIETDENLCKGSTVSLDIQIISTGLNSPNKEQIKVFPNPFKQFTTLKFNNLKGSQYKLYIIDLSGKVCRIVDNITTSEYVLQRGDLKQGFYFIELRGPNIYRGKIIIE